MNEFHSFFTAILSEIADSLIDDFGTLLKNAKRYKNATTVDAIKVVDEKGRFVIGIQTTRYKNVSKMKHIPTEELPLSKDKEIAVF